jgi:agmatinase
MAYVVRSKRTLPLLQRLLGAGLSYFDVIDLIAGVASKARIVGLDLVELVPERDLQNIGAICAARIICNAIGCAAKQKL